ncbi:MAG: butyrate kinase [Candidatus Aminicenantes bacterium]|nr:butyrate kinase [Candidatus Aminicenantes bacterium]
MRRNNKNYRILAINPGSTSTKIALFENEREIFYTTISHSAEELSRFKSIMEQKDYRTNLVLKELEEKGVELSSLSAVVGRGGLLKPLESGTYEVNEKMIEDLKRAERGEHASNLGAVIAMEIAKMAGVKAYIVDPVSVDELPKIAKITGMKEIEKPVLSHALNTKAVAKRFAREKGTLYEKLRLIVVHLGSGNSISAHVGGKMVDVTNSMEEGSFGMDRAGGVPCMQLLKLAFSGKYEFKELKRKLFGEGGMYSYLGIKDFRDVEKRIINGDDEAILITDSMIYQIAKDVGAMATVLNGKVDAILITGGLAKSNWLVKNLRRRIEFIAPVHVYPGEDELRALTEGALRVLKGEEQAKIYS